MNSDAKDAISARWYALTGFFRKENSQPNADMFFRYLTGQNAVPMSVCRNFISVSCVVCANVSVLIRPYHG